MYDVSVHMALMLRMKLLTVSGRRLITEVNEIYQTHFYSFFLHLCWFMSFSVCINQHYLSQYLTRQRLFMLLSLWCMRHNIRWKENPFIRSSRNAGTWYKVTFVM